MTAKDTMKRLQDELEHLRTRMDELRVQGNLGKLEAKDRLTEYKAAIEPAYEKAKTTLSEVTRAGAEETKTMAKSLVAAWDELRRTHRALSEEAEREREQAQKLRRTGGS